MWVKSETWHRQVGDLPIGRGNGQRPKANGKRLKDIGLFLVVLRWRFSWNYV